ncbi:porin family protein [Pseudolabrys taiwanensis]|uniref:Porin family protein n=1 Tax=Pseudolabrys taiwanensis TaxID=331696 RepID=A0A345ZXP4_9HYPH|nr:porin family protein [Pseudolabrys taiwanensis]
MRGLTSIVSAIAVSTAAVITIAHAQNAPVDSWTGFYFGTHLGTAAAYNGWQSESTGAPYLQPFPDSFTSGGALSGVQFGYNYQAGNWVLGAEADASFADIEGSARCGKGNYVCTTHVDALGTFGLRGGYTVNGLLLYGKAGGAWLHEQYDTTPSPGAGRRNIAQGKATRLGFMLGAGVEYAFYRNLSARLEYNYLDFNSGSLSATDQSGATTDFGVHQQLHLIKLGLNYKLGETSPLSGWPLSGGGGTAGHDWTGLFVGAHAGGSWGTTDWKSADGRLGAISTSSFAGTGTMDGLLGGLQAGYNKQFGTIVAGIESDVSWGNLDGYAKCATSESVRPLSVNCRSRINVFGTVTGRLGVTYDNLLIYGRAGFAWAHEMYDARRDAAYISGSAMRTGYAVGSGLEYAFSPAWSGRFEYRYIDLGTSTVALAANSNVSNVSLAQRNHMATFALNYHIGADAGTGAMAADFPVKAPPVFSDWEMEVGTRLWYSNGKSQQDLYDSINTQVLNSRLIYGGMTGPSLEGFARFDHRSGLFVKANFGMGSLVDGQLHDEDTPPGTVPYSNTSHDMRDGSLRFGSADVGYSLIATPAGRIGPFIGYRYFYQLGRAYGCQQVGPGTFCVPTVPTSNLALTETEQWRGFALGVNSKLALDNRTSLEVDAAWVPLADRAGVDNHWRRADINPGPENGRAWGAQLEGVLNYALTPRWSIGVGGRYWFFTTTNGSARFPDAAESSPTKFTSHRYGAFVQTSYKFGGPTGTALPESLPPADWNGVYAGAHLGAGFGRSTWADPFPTPVTGDYTVMGGALSGLQIGINKQFGHWVVGAEAAASLALLEGSNTCFGGNPIAALAALECENRTSGIGLLTARLGYAFGRSLVYARAGGALARETYTINAIPADGGIDTQRRWNAGWTVGGGIEQALTDRWSVNAEYKYLDFGSRTVHFNVPGALDAVADTAVRSQRQIVTLGLNYKFGQP